MATRMGRTGPSGPSGPSGPRRQGQGQDRGRAETAARLPCVDGTPAHRWRLSTPEPGVPVVAATCRRCGAERTYDAYYDETLAHAVWTAWREGGLSPKDARDVPTDWGWND